MEADRILPRRPSQTRHRTLPHEDSLRDGSEHRVPRELGCDHTEREAVERFGVDLVRRRREQDVAVGERVERMDGASHRGMDLSAELTQQPAIHPLVRGDDRERRALTGEPRLDSLDERATRAGRRVEVTADDVSVAVDDGADGVHDREDGDARVAEAAKRAALTAGLSVLEPEGLADGRGAAGASPSQREATLLRGSQRRPAELLVGIDRVLAWPEVEDDRARDVGDRRPARVVAALGEQLRRHARAGLASVQRAARQADRVHPVEVAEETGRAATDVSLEHRAAGEVKDGAARRAFLVLGDADAKAREVELERIPVEAGQRVHATATSAASAAFAATSSRFAASVRPSLRSCRKERTKGVTACPDTLFRSASASASSIRGSTSSRLSSGGRATRMPPRASPQCARATRAASSAESTRAGTDGPPRAE